ncbi:yippee-like protein [Ceraceosorus guamensis]|uniref:Protein yippee-like n=1 Tax=Ceraceosorus guamensis TaxID=1522189 RepID=A0A316VUM2_9BASI|nr:yippee-like protein [Ceraceosorus guamensis]PWN40143.1 yippee-like protein [Ceraceosorus guamensis]
MGFQHTQFLASPVQVYGCVTCRTHLATNENLISKNFNGSTGRAFLFEEVVNVECGEAVDRHMTTGLHNVRDIFCIRCNASLGWRYEKSFVQAEKYKEGKFILERARIADVE